MADPGTSQLQFCMSHFLMINKHRHIYKSITVSTLEAWDIHSSFNYLSQLQKKGWPSKPLRWSFTFSPGQNRRWMRLRVSSSGESWITSSLLLSFSVSKRMFPFLTTYRTSRPRACTETTDQARGVYESLHSLGYFGGRFRFWGNGKWEESRSVHELLRREDTNSCTDNSSR